MRYSRAKQGFSSRTAALSEGAGCDLLTSVAVFLTGTQPVVVASPVVHHAAHSEYLGEALLPVSLRRPHSAVFQGAVLASGMDHSMSIHPTSMMGPLTQQLNHLSIGSSGTVSRTPSMIGS